MEKFTEKQMDLLKIAFEITTSVILVINFLENWDRMKLVIRQSITNREAGSEALYNVNSLRIQFNVDTAMAKLCYDIGKQLERQNKVEEILYP